ncbi:hypothetical protein [Amaricoccus sp. W119]|uniref:hypothetical protein n=1 Tax=Amaricoccus sp. W119 TaxID=3391833 RepID=UPI0039A5D14C
MNPDDRPQAAEKETGDLADLRARREAVKRMMTVAAVTPMVAMLFDPRKALASGEGSGTEEP